MKRERKGMIYIVDLISAGRIVGTREVYGMDAVSAIQDLYEDTDIEVDFTPDVFRYLRLNRNEVLS